MKDALDVLLNLDKMYPGMSWYISDRGSLVIDIPISDKEVETLRMASKLVEM